MKVLFYLLSFTSLLLQAQPIRKEWKAAWIKHPDAKHQKAGLYHFRKTFEVDQLPTSLWIDVSADQRYQCYINGKLVHQGPYKSDLQHWRFHSINIAPYLQKGKNCLAIAQWNYGERSPVSFQGKDPGILVHTDSTRFQSLNTGKGSTWICKNDQSIVFAPHPRNLGYLSSPYGEIHQVDSYDVQWFDTQFKTDSLWKNAVYAIAANFEYVFSYDHDRLLEKNTLPELQQDTIYIKRIRKSNLAFSNFQLGKKNLSVQVPAFSKKQILIDQEVYQNAHPLIWVSTGDRTQIKLTYAESLFDTSVHIGNTPWKGNRNQTEGKVLKGIQDVFQFKSNFQGKIQPLWWRSGRYILLEIETESTPCTIQKMVFVSNYYPLQKTSSIEMYDDSLQKIEEIGWRTIRMCANETYMDCPYYEQMMYTGDTRIQALATLYNSNEDAYIQNALKILAQSIGSHGIMMSRAPTSIIQYIPGFSLYWISILNDYAYVRNQKAFVESYWHLVPQIIHFFEKHQNEDGILKALPFWNFCDWVEKPTWKAGVPPKDSLGHSALNDLQLLGAYLSAESLATALQKPEAEMYRLKIKKLRGLIYQYYYDQASGFLADHTERTVFSQHAQALGVLYDVFPKESQSKVMINTIQSKNLDPCSIYFQYYLNQALVKAGMGEQYVQNLQLYKEQIRNGLTTWAEEPEPSRSDCHAWGSSPNIEFYRTVLGIRSNAFGFESVHIEPHVQAFQKINGKMPHPKGSIQTNYRKTKLGYQALVELPETIYGTLLWKGKTYDLKPGSNVFLLP